jgi:kinesin family protein 18/19
MWLTLTVMSDAMWSLNVEVAELKEKLVGRRASESDVVARKKAEAKAELERAKSDIQLKVEQTKASIVEGATCSGKLSIAKVKLGAIQARLFKLKQQAQRPPLRRNVDYCKH